MSVDGSALATVLTHGEGGGRTQTLCECVSEDLETEQALLPDFEVDQRVSGYLALGNITLRNVRGTLDLRQAQDRDVNIALYQEWLLDDHYLTLEKRIDRLVLDGSASCPGERERVLEWQVVKCRKRGNDVDAWRIDNKMEDLEAAIVPYCQSQDPERPLRTTRALYVTLTVDPRMTGGDLEAAWLHVGRWFNDFKSRLGKTFGTVLCGVEEDAAGEKRLVSRAAPCKTHQLRSWEAHGGGDHDGWPHVHAVLCFEDFHFKMFKDNNGLWRIKHKDRFQDAWPYGFVDVLALTPGTLGQQLPNVLWYVSKNLSSMDYRLVRSWPRKRLLTQSILWYYGLRSFSVSRALLEEDRRASQDDLTKRTCITQNDLFGRGYVLELVSYRFLGLVRRKDTELTREDWAKTYSDPPSWLDRVWKPYSHRGGLGWSSSWLSGGS